MYFTKFIFAGIFLLSVSFSNIKAQNQAKILDIPYVNSVSTESYFILTKNKDTLYFVRAEKFTSKAKKTIYISTKLNDYWSKPIPISFNLENFSDDSPFLTLDGKTMFFTSNRPGSIEGSKDVWKSVKVKGRWLKPENLGNNVNSPSSEFGVSVAQNGNLYFGSSRKESKGMGDIYYSKLTNNKYDKAVNLGESINTKTGEWGSVVSPDESFIIFESHGRESNVSFAGDLYISFRHEGKWQLAKNMLKFNSIGSDLAPRLHVFSNTLYFSSNRNDKPNGDNTDIFYVNLNEVLKNNSINHYQKTTYKSKIDLSIKDWKLFIHDVLDNKEIYTKNAFRISTNGEVTRSAQVDNQFKKNKISVDTIFSVFSTPANQNESIIYEISGFKNKSKNNYRVLNIWQEVEGYVKEIEIIGEVNPSSPEINKSIQKRRQDWMNLCNQHLPDSLVSNLYSKNAIYFNHKPLVIGTDSISKEYQYMKYNNYNLKLNPLYIEVVNENFVFEIGQCEGSYKGKYILVWKKNSNGIWKILFDSNI